MAKKGQEKSLGIHGAQGKIKSLNGTFTLAPVNLKAVPHLMPRSAGRFSQRGLGLTEMMLVAAIAIAVTSIMLVTGNKAYESYKVQRATDFVQLSTNKIIDYYHVSADTSDIATRMPEILSQAEGATLMTSVTGESSINTSKIGELIPKAIAFYANFQNTVSPSGVDTRQTSTQTQQTPYGGATSPTSPTSPTGGTSGTTNPTGPDSGMPGGVQGKKFSFNLDLNSGGNFGDISLNELYFATGVPVKYRSAIGEVSFYSQTIFKANDSWSMQFKDLNESICAKFLSLVSPQFVGVALNGEAQLNEDGQFVPYLHLDGATASARCRNASLTNDGKITVELLAPSLFSRTYNRVVHGNDGGLAAGTDPIGKVIFDPTEGTGTEPGTEGVNPKDGVTLSSRNQVDHDGDLIDPCGGWKGSGFTDGSTVDDIAGCNRVMPAASTPAPPGADMCSNLSGLQTSVPLGYDQSGTNCTPQDKCGNIPGVQEVRPDGMMVENVGGVNTCTPITQPASATEESCKARGLILVVASNGTKSCAECKTATNTQANGTSFQVSGKYHNGVCFYPGILTTYSNVVDTTGSTSCLTINGMGEMINSVVSSPPTASEVPAGFTYSTSESFLSWNYADVSRVAGALNIPGTTVTDCKFQRYASDDYKLNCNATGSFTCGGVGGGSGTAGTGGVVTTPTGP